MILDKEKVYRTVKNKDKFKMLYHRENFLSFLENRCNLEDFKEDETHYYFVFNRTPISYEEILQDVIRTPIDKNNISYNYLLYTDYNVDLLIKQRLGKELYFTNVAKEDRNLIRLPISKFSFKYQKMIPVYLQTHYANRYDLYFNYHSSPLVYIDLGDKIDSFKEKIAFWQLKESIAESICDLILKNKPLVKE